MVALGVNLEKTAKKTDSVPERSRLGLSHARLSWADFLPPSNPNSIAQPLRLDLLQDRGGNFFDEDGEDDFEGGEDDFEDFDESSEEEVENFAAKNANKRAKN